METTRHPSRLQRIRLALAAILHHRGGFAQDGCAPASRRLRSGDEQRQAGIGPVRDRLAGGRRGHSISPRAAAQAATCAPRKVRTQRLPRWLATCAVAAVASTGALAQWTPDQIDLLADGFVAGISGSYKVAQRRFAFMDVAQCFDPGNGCFGANPDSPYAMPNGLPAFESSTPMAKTDAQVLIMVTPPPLVYFGITPYLFSHYYRKGSPVTGGVPGFGTIFESIGDTINMTATGTTGSDLPGENSYSQLAVFVLTADTGTFSDIRTQLTALGLPGSAINQIGMPVAAAPLTMLPNPEADRFLMMLRIAYPADRDALQRYIDRAPFRFMTLSPVALRLWVSSGTPVGKVPGNGVTEAPPLANARDRLIDQLVDEYRGRYEVSELSPVQLQTNNFACLKRGVPCNGDNPDAVYARITSDWNPAPGDKLLLVGVDHVATGKATYISTTVMDDQHQTGVISAGHAPGSGSMMLAGSAVRMAGITDRRDPRYGTYSRLYALTLGYDCTGEVVCLQIPVLEKDGDGRIVRVGIAPGDTISVLQRAYVDPATGTRPSTDEIIPERAFVLRALNQRRPGRRHVDGRANSPVGQE